MPTYFFMIMFYWQLLPFLGNGNLFYNEIYNIQVLAMNF